MCCVLCLVTQSCPTLCNPVDCNLLDPSVQARILEWVVMPSSRGSSESRGRTQVSCIVGGFFTICAATVWVCVCVPGITFIFLKFNFKNAVLFFILVYKFISENSNIFF